MVYVIQKLKTKNKSVTLRLAPLAYNDAYKKFLESAMRYVSSKAIPIKCFVSHRATDPFFWKSPKKKSRITRKETSTLLYKHMILSY